VGCIVVVNASPTLLKTASRRPSAPSAVGEGNATVTRRDGCGPAGGGVATAVTRATRPRVGAVRTVGRRSVAVAYIVDCAHTLGRKGHHHATL